MAHDDEQNAGNESPRFYKLELQVERFRIQLERIVADIESEKRTRSEANSEIRSTIERMAEKFNDAIKEVSENYRGALKELSNELRESYKILELHNKESEHKTQEHLRRQDVFQYKMVGALIGINTILAFLSPWIYRTLGVN